MNDISVRSSSRLPEVSLIAVGAFLWRGKLRIGACVLLFAAAALGLGLLRTPKYRSEVVFSPASNSGSGLSDIGGGQLGSLAAIAGINIGGTAKRSEEQLEYLRSRGFTAHFIERHGLIPVLFANKWDARSGRWRGDPPTMADAVKKFSTRVRQIAEDRRTGIVTLAIIWSDRFAAAQWANALVAEADDALRQRAIAELNRSIEFLKAESAHADVLQVESAVYKVMESELKDAMLARTRDAYAFKILDPAVVRDKKDTDSPIIPLYVLGGAALGLLVGAIWTFVRSRPTAGRA